MALTVAAAPGAVRIRQGAFDRVARSTGGPVGTLVQSRGLRVTRAMKLNASGRPGPNVRTGNLHAAIGFLRFGSDAVGPYAHIGLHNHRMIRRGYNYALILEGLFPRGGAPPDGHYPFMVRSIDAARD